MTTMKSIKSLFVALLCVFTLSSCSNHKLNGEWKVVEINGIAVGETLNEPFLNIADGKYNGNTSVNYINGEVKICPFGCSVEFEDGACTRMAADPYSMEMEHSFLEALDDVEKFTLEGDVVLLKDEHDIVLMKLARK